MSTAIQLIVHEAYTVATDNHFNPIDTANYILEVLRGWDGTTPWSGEHADTQKGNVFLATGTLGAITHLMSDRSRRPLETLYGSCVAGGMLQYFEELELKIEGTEDDIEPGKKTDRGFRRRCLAIIIYYLMCVCEDDYFFHVREPGTHIPASV
jgi:hypothetical protein